MLGKEMTKAISKLCAGLCFVGALAVMPACGDSGSKSNCENGQKEAEVNGTKGCYDACMDGACATGFSCKSGLCIADSSNANSNTNSNTNSSTNSSNTNSSNTNSMNTNGNPNNTMIDPTIQALCESYADLLYGTCFDSCTLDTDLQTAVDNAYDVTLNGDGTAQNPGCPQRLTDNPQLVQQYQDFVDQNTCATLAGYRCGDLGLTTECNCAPPTNLGAACADDTACMGGDLEGFCVTEMDNPDWAGGQCLAGNCPSSDQAPDGYFYNTDVCGAGGVCENIIDDMGNAFGVCFGGCGTGCRAGYGCQVANITQEDDAGTMFAVVRTCDKACTANADCASDDTFRCDTTAGSCQFQCDATPDPMNPNDPTLADLCTATGGTCVMDAALGKEYCQYN